jgi:hypothetical protein
MNNEEIEKDGVEGLEGLRKIRESVENPDIKNLLKETHLTKRQLETLLIWRELKKDEKKLKIRNNIIMTEKTISKGSFYRILKQARSNIRKSISTIIILYLFELLDEKTLSILNNTINTIINADEGLRKEIMKHVHRYL